MSKAASLTVFTSYKNKNLNMQMSYYKNIETYLFSELKDEVFNENIEAIEICLENLKNVKISMQCLQYEINDANK